MEKKYKTFEDLEFCPWGEKITDRYVPPMLRGGKHAVMEFSNGYGVSVLFGSMFYSDGVGTYELAVTKGGGLVYPEEICGSEYPDVLGYLTKDEVTEAMRKVQDL